MERHFQVTKISHRYVGSLLALDFPFFESFFLTFTFEVDSLILEVGMQDIANDFKVPRYCLYPSPTPFLSLMYNLPKFDAEGLTPLPSDAKPLEIPNFPPLAYSLMPRSFKVDEDVFPYEFQLYQAKRLREAAGVLVNSVYELEHEIITGLQNSFAGGLEHDQVSSIADKIFCK